LTPENETAGAGTEPATSQSPVIGGPDVNAHTTDIQPEEPKSHKTIAVALAHAQADMGKALKSAKNPHFGSKYADLSSVMDACLPALNANGIAVIQPMRTEGDGRSVVTIFLHESGEELECSIPLIVGKNDMQGLGSAITYARRYGLMSLAGIAPEDDDGNDAGRNKRPTVSADQYIQLRDKAEEAGVSEEKLVTAYGAVSLQQFPADMLQKAMTKLNATIKAKQTAELDDSIPEFEGATQ
jgi:hypothetical protein